MILINIMICVSSLSGNLEMYICICHAVTDHQIRNEVQAGAGSLRVVSERLGVATCCGKCGKCARRLVKETLRELRDERLMAAVPVNA